MSLEATLGLAITAYVVVSFPVAVLVGRMLRGPVSDSEWCQAVWTPYPGSGSARLAVVPAFAPGERPLGRADMTHRRAVTLVARDPRSAGDLQVSGPEADPTHS